MHNDNEVIYLQEEFLTFLSWITRYNHDGSTRQQNSLNCIVEGFKRRQSYTSPAVLGKASCMDQQCFCFRRCTRTFVCSRVISLLTLRKHLFLLLLGQSRKTVLGRKCLSKTSSCLKVRYYNKTGRSFKKGEKHLLCISKRKHNKTNRNITSDVGNVNITS